MSSYLGGLGHGSSDMCNVFRPPLEVAKEGRILEKSDTYKTYEGVFLVGDRFLPDFWIESQQNRLEINKGWWRSTLLLSHPNHNPLTN